MQQEYILSETNKKNQFKYLPQVCLIWNIFSLCDYQTQCSRGCSINTFVINSLINSLSQWYFCSESSRHCLLQIVRARELKLWENIDPPPYSCTYCGQKFDEYEDFHDHEKSDLVLVTGDTGQVVNIVWKF